MHCGNSTSPPIWTPEEKLIAASADQKIKKEREPIAELVRILTAKDEAALSAFATKKLYPSIDPIAEDLGKLV